jgi:uncharacterized RDD family membrane protein YckC
MRSNFLLRRALLNQAYGLCDHAGPVTDTPVSTETAGLLRRLAAMFYDALLLLGLWMIATALFLPFTGGEAVLWKTTPLLFVLHKLVLAAIVICFYGIFWTRQGHTLGMASWRLQLVRLDGRRPTWGDALRRLGAAVLSWLPLGLGWWWSLFDADKRTWHDMLSQTRVELLPPRRRRA